MYVVVHCITFGHVFMLSVDLLDVEFTDRQHLIAAVQDFPHPTYAKRFLPSAFNDMPDPHCHTLDIF